MGLRDIVANMYSGSFTRRLHPYCNVVILRSVGFNHRCGCGYLFDNVQSRLQTISIRTVIAAGFKVCLSERPTDSILERVTHKLDPGAYASVYIFEARSRRVCYSLRGRVHVKLSLPYRGFELCPLVRSLTAVSNVI
jgi:hypothetical protein